MSDALILISGRELYDALKVGDVRRLKELLSPDFQGRLTKGLPNGYGRDYDGLNAMMNDGWGAVSKSFDMHPDLAELFDGGSVLVGKGNYIGKALPSGKPIKAAFAHFWAFDGKQFTAVEQVTDSVQWHEALRV